MGQLPAGLRGPDSHAGCLLSLGFLTHSPSAGWLLARAWTPVAMTVACVNGWPDAEFKPPTPHG